MTAWLLRRFGALALAWRSGSAPGWPPMGINLVSPEPHRILATRVCENVI